MENKRNAIKKEELQEELTVMLKDEFVANVTNDSALCMQFLNGQKFRIIIEEV